MTAAELYESDAGFRGFIRRWVTDRACPLELADYLLDRDTVSMTCPRCKGRPTKFTVCNDCNTPVEWRDTFVQGNLRQRPACPNHGWRSNAGVEAVPLCVTCSSTGSVVDPSYDLLAEAARWAAGFPMRPVWIPDAGEDPTPCGLFPILVGGTFLWTGGDALDCASDLPNGFRVYDFPDHAFRYFEHPPDALCWALDEAARVRPWEKHTVTP